MKIDSDILVILISLFIMMISAFLSYKFLIKPLDKYYPQEDDNEDSYTDSYNDFYDRE